MTHIVLQKFTTNKSLLVPQQARVLVKRLPDICFFTQKTAIPSLRLPIAETPNPLTNLKYAGDHISWDFLPVTFLVDEYLTNWISAFQWMIGLGFPNDASKEYKPLQEAGKNYGDGIESDVVQVIMDNKGNPRLEVTYKDCKPVSLSGVEFDVSASPSSVATATLELAYTSYEIARIESSLN